MNSRKIILYLALYLAAVVAVVALSYFGIQWGLTNQMVFRSSFNFVSMLFPTLAKGHSLTKKPVEKLIRSSDNIEYLLYGTVVSVEQELRTGLFIKFILDGDPSGTRLSVFLRKYNNKYKIYMYDSKFGENLNLRVTDSIGLKKAFNTTSQPSGLYVSFIFSPMTEQDQQVMSALEGANLGVWERLPLSQTVNADGFVIINNWRR